MLCVCVCACACECDHRENVSTFLKDEALLK